MLLNFIYFFYGLLFSWNNFLISKIIQKDRRLSQRIRFCCVAGCIGKIATTQLWVILKTSWQKTIPQNESRCSRLSCRTCEWTCVLSTSPNLDWLFVSNFCSATIKGTQASLVVISYRFLLSGFKFFKRTFILYCNCCISVKAYEHSASQQTGFTTCWYLTEISITRLLTISYLSFLIFC